mmetsp:Transcript_16300/g.44667  ORF Transcript_16300/g.44667 Transcript_16300/m.44667 type:complete len:116 (+) Transcript_16300:928-1275(+)|eukprot:1161461-Pelagomonas_calceolata.AAC.5
MEFLSHTHVQANAWRVLPLLIGHCLTLAHTTSKAQSPVSGPHRCRDSSVRTLTSPAPNNLPSHEDAQMSLALMLSGSCTHLGWSSQDPSHSTSWQAHAYGAINKGKPIGPERFHP